MKIGLEYIKYRWKAKKRHGIHSPFVYDISDVALRIKVETSDQKWLQALFNKLSSSQKEIEVQDFGVGSRKLNKRRKISSIFAISSSKGRYGILLYQLCKHFQPARILEFGTSLSVGTTFMHLGAPSSTITTVEACPNTRRCALDNLSHFDPEKITSIESTFREFLDHSANGTYDLVYIDGHHDGKALLEYMNDLRPFTNDRSIFVLDDIRWSNSMLEAWNTLCKSQEFHVSIDLFRSGILVRRPEQQKEHFVLRV